MLMLIDSSVRYKWCCVLMRAVQADLARLAGVLQRVQWTAINERTLVVWLRGSNNQRQMAAVRALRFGDGPAAVNHVKVNTHTHTRTHTHTHSPTIDHAYTNILPH